MFKRKKAFEAGAKFHKEIERKGKLRPLKDLKLTGKKDYFVRGGGGK